MCSASKFDNDVSHDKIVDTLVAKGVYYLASTATTSKKDLLDNWTLIVTLASSKDARLNFSLAALFLRNPAMAQEALEMLSKDEQHAGINLVLRQGIVRQAAAAMYLQRLWATRLRQRFGPQVAISDWPAKYFDFPAPEILNGKIGLKALCEQRPYNDWSAYQQVVDLLCDTPAPKNSQGDALA